MRYRDDRAAQRDRVRVLEEELAEAEREIATRDAALAAREAELAKLKQAGVIPTPKPRSVDAPARKFPPFRAVAPHHQKLGALGMGIGVVLLIGFAWWGNDSSNYGQARIYVSDRDTKSAEYFVNGVRRCAGAMCDLKLRPGTYHVKAVAGDRSGAITLVVRAQHSSATPIPLTDGPPGR